VAEPIEVPFGGLTCGPMSHTLDRVHTHMGFTACCFVCLCICWRWPVQTHPLDFALYQLYRGESVPAPVSAHWWPYFIQSLIYCHVMINQSEFACHVLFCVNRKMEFHWAEKHWLIMLVLTSGFSVSSVICRSSSLRLDTLIICW